jgi:uncharacterized protein
MKKGKENEIILVTVKYIREVFNQEGSGHDWFHIDRVRNLALQISQKEGGDKFLIEMSALLHDLDDWKLTGTTPSSRAEDWLRKLEVAPEVAHGILQIISEVSFKGAGVTDKVKSLEAGIVQDADRLDAMGAIGIARTFAYGGFKGRLIYHPDINPEDHSDAEMYKANSSPTINHFYEKLLLLKDRMNTQTARSFAIRRHDFMIRYLDEFFLDWNEGLQI